MCDFFSFGCNLFQGGSTASVISFPLGAINPKEGRQFEYDSFPLGAFSRRGELLLKPLAF